MHACIQHVSNCCVWINCCYLQARITECDLVETGLIDRGPGRLATQVTNPPPGLGFIHASQPFLSLSSRVSSSEVFVVDGVVVVFVGFSSGQVRKVCGVCLHVHVWYTHAHISLHKRSYLSIHCSWGACQISDVITTKSVFTLYNNIKNNPLQPSLVRVIIQTCLPSHWEKKEKKEKKKISTIDGAPGCT